MHGSLSQSFKWHQRKTLQAFNYFYSLLLSACKKVVVMLWIHSWCKTTNLPRNNKKNVRLFNGMYGMQVDMIRHFNTTKIQRSILTYVQISTFCYLPSFSDWTEDIFVQLTAMLITSMSSNSTPVYVKVKCIPRIEICCSYLSCGAATNYVLMI